VPDDHEMGRAPFTLSKPPFLSKSGPIDVVGSAVRPPPISELV
jgi:hypothetical protein